MKSALRFGLIVLVVFSEAALAAPRLKIVDVVSEEIDPAVPVSNAAGGAVGLSAASKKADGKADAGVWVSVPEKFHGKVKILVTAIDGRYRAEFILDVIAVGVRKWERVVLDTAPSKGFSLRQSTIRGYTRDQLAFLISPVDPPDTPAGAVKYTDAVFLVSNTDPDADKGKGTMKTAVLVSSLGADRVTYRLPGSTKVFPCEPLLGLPARYFDFACVMPVEHLLALGGGLDMVRISRQAGAKTFTPIRIRVL